MTEFVVSACWARKCFLVTNHLSEIIASLEDDNVLLKLNAGFISKSYS